MLLIVLDQMEVLSWKRIVFKILRTLEVFVS